jgi:hypothetical protein
MSIKYPCFMHCPFFPPPRHRATSAIQALSIPVKDRLAQKKVTDDTASQLSRGQTLTIGFSFQDGRLTFRQEQGQLLHFLVKRPKSARIKTRDYPAAFFSFHAASCHFSPPGPSLYRARL